ncbi:MAG: hypothetical protein JXR41_06125 [Bacteroidales bacterium]|nr:hypothetical protein [Bacteroidales bacterium]MBN2762647.1 hypothetical protein [Bacteroidales bacterium]
MIQFNNIINITKIRLFLGSAIMIVLLAASDRNNLPMKPEDKIDWYNKYYPMEQVFLHTDKYMYKPGETVWFKGYVASFTCEQTPLYSNDLYIKLLDHQNEELVYRRYPIVNNGVSGYITLPKSTGKGKYHLVAYTSWMKNIDPDRIFAKELIVVKNNRRRIIADFRLLDEKPCFSDTLRAILHVRNQNGEPVSGASVAYYIQGLDKKLKQGNTITDPQGIAQVNEIIPLHKIRNACFINFIISSKQGTGKYIFPLPYSSEDVRLQFISGHNYLLRGHENMINFKAFTKDGFPVCCEGEIINQEGKALLLFKSGINGQGSFTMTPTDSVYKARIVFPPGDSLFLLPSIRTSGIYLDYKGIQKNALLFEVIVIPELMNMKTTWIASSSRKKYWSSEIDVSGNTLVKIPMPEGRKELIQVSVFGENNDLLYDNLIKGETTENPLQIITDKNSYSKRKKVTVEIIVSKPCFIKGNLDLSISVAQKHLTEHKDNPSIDEYMLFENRFPDAIYKTITFDTNAFLAADKPLPVNWETINLASENGEERYYNRDGLTGIVYDKRKVPVAYAKVKAINIANWKFYETQCDESGIFRVLFGADIIDFNYLNINAFDASGKTTLWPSVDQDFSKAVNTAFQISTNDIARQQITDHLKFPYPDVLASFEYQEKKKKLTEHETKKISSPQQYVNYFSVIDIVKDLQPLDIINNQIFFKGIHNAYANQNGALIIIDGLAQGTHANIIHNLVPTDIVYIDILTTPGEIKRYTNQNYLAAIEITTVRGIAQNRMLPGLSCLDMLELNRGFNSPDYTDKTKRKDDPRTTLYWNPGIILPEKDTLMTITFYTSDIEGFYTVNVQGFDDYGNPVSAKAKFVVKASEEKLQKPLLKRRLFGKQ